METPPTWKIKVTIVDHRQKRPPRRTPRTFGEGYYPPWGGCNIDDDDARVDERRDRKMHSAPSVTPLSRELSCESCVFSARWGIDEDASDATACLQPTSSTEPPPMRNMYLQRANRDSHVRPTLSSRSFIRPRADLKQTHFHLYLQRTYETHSSMMMTTTLASGDALLEMASESPLKDFSTC